MMASYPGSHFSVQKLRWEDNSQPHNPLWIQQGVLWYNFWVSSQLKTSEFLKINLHKEKPIMLLWLQNSSTLHIR